MLRGICGVLDAGAPARHTGRLWGVVVVTFSKLVYGEARRWVGEFAVRVVSRQHGQGFWARTGTVP